MITIKNKVNFKPIDRMLSKLGTDISTKMIPRALNRSMVTVRKEASIEARKHVNLPATGTSKGGKGSVRPGISPLLSNDTATSSKMSVSLWAKTKGISLIHFVAGLKAQEDQKGKSIKARRKLMVSVTPGTKFHFSKSFILVVNGAVQVFARQGARSKPTYKRAVKGLFAFLDKPEIRQRLQDIGIKRFNETIQQDVRYFVARLNKKLDGG